MKFSKDIREQSDYKITMKMITNMLNTNGPQGSIVFGQFYAKKYKNMFDEMLKEDIVNNVIFQDALSSVDEDLRTVRNDCNRRIRSSFTDANDDMMSMITDFVKSL